MNATVALGHEIDPVLRGQLEEHLSVSPGSACVLYDGASGVLPAGELSNHVAGGATVVIVRPDDGHAAMLGQICGVTAGAGHDALALSRGVDGRNRLTVFTSQAPATVGIGARLAEFVRRPMAMGVGDSSPTLFPPAGAVFGSVLVEVRSTGSLGGAPADCPYVHSQNPQNASSFVLNTFYVYLVNGQGAPYYLVILKQTGACGSTGMLMDSPNGRGYAMFDVLLSVKNLTSSGTVLGMATSPNSGETAAQVNQAMQLQVNVPGGTAVQTFHAQDGIQMSLTDWAVMNTSQPAAPESDWRFYQTGVWNPVNDPLPTGPLAFFSASGPITALPAISASTLGLTTYSVWMVLPAPPAPSTLTGSISLTQDFYIAYVSYVNSGAFGGWNGFHTAPIAVTVPFSLALNQIAQPTE
jgi:hypothetical protein